MMKMKITPKIKMTPKIRLTQKSKKITKLILPWKLRQFQNKDKLKNKKTLKIMMAGFICCRLVSMYSVVCWILLNYCIISFFVLANVRRYFPLFGDITIISTVFIVV